MNLKNPHSNNEYSNENPSRENASDDDASSVNSGRRKLLESLESCRPGSDDFERLLDAETVAAVHSDAELTRRYGLVQQFDTTVARAYADVPVPGGLENRLLAALAADALVTQVEKATAENVTANVAADVRPLEARPGESHSVAPARMSRRGWLAACGAAGAATAAGLAGFWFLRPGEPVEMTVEQLLDDAFALHNSEGEQTPAVAIDVRNAPTDFPVSREFAVNGARLPRRNVDGKLLGRPGVAYELAPVGQPRATLYVLGDRSGAQGVAGVPDAASGLAQKTTGNRALGAWREGGLLYVFVVEGDEHRYRGYFKQSTGVYA